MSKGKSSYIGSSWDDLERQLFTPEEIEASRIRVAKITKKIKARNKKKNLKK